MTSQSPSGPRGRWVGATAGAAAGTRLGRGNAPKKGGARANQRRDSTATSIHAETVRFVCIFIYSM